MADASHTVSHAISRQELVWWEFSRQVWFQITDIYIYIYGLGAQMHNAPGHGTPKQSFPFAHSKILVISELHGS